MSIDHYSKVYLFSAVFSLSMIGFGFYIYSAPLGPPATTCFFVILFGIPCIACGGTHAIQSLLHGHFSEAIHFNTFAFLLFIISLVLMSIIIFDLLSSSRILIYLYQRSFSYLKKRSFGLALAFILIAFWVVNIIRYLK